MAVLSTNDNVKVLVNGAAKAVLRKHAANSIFYQTLWRALKHFLGGAAVLTTWVT